MPPPPKPPSPPSKTCCCKVQASSCIITLLMIFTTACLLIVVLSSSFLRTVNIVNRNVTIGRVNGSLSLGSLGYCLEVSDNTTCSSAKLPYSINNTQVLAQVKMGSTTTTILPIANVVALVAAFLTSVSAYWCRTSKSSRIFGTIAAGTGTLFVFIGFLFDIIFIATSSGLKGAGVGFWLTGIAFVVLLIFVIAAVCYGRTPKEEEKIEQPENQVQQPIDPRADPYYYGNNGPGMQGNINPADLLAFLRNQGGETGPGKDAMLQAPGKIETPKKSGKWW